MPMREPEPILRNHVARLGKFPAGDQVGDLGKILADIEVKVAIPRISRNQRVFIELKMLAGCFTKHHCTQPAIADR